MHLVLGIPVPPPNLPYSLPTYTEGIEDRDRLPN